MAYYFGNDYNAVQAAAARDEALRQQASQFAMSNLMNAIQMDNRRKELRNAMAQRQQELSGENDYRNRLFNEQVRQWNESMALSREPAPAKPMSQNEFKDAITAIDLGYDIDGSRMTDSQQRIAENRKKLNIDAYNNQESGVKAINESRILGDRLAREEAVPRPGLMKRSLTKLWDNVPYWAPFKAIGSGYFGGDVSSPALPLPPEDLAGLQQRAQAQRTMVGRFDPNFLQDYMQTNALTGSVSGRMPMPQYAPGFSNATPNRVMAPITNAPPMAAAPVVNLPPPAVSLTRTNAPAMTGGGRIVRQGKYIFSLNPDGTATFIGNAP